MLLTLPLPPLLLLTHCTGKADGALTSSGCDTSASIISETPGSAPVPGLPRQKHNRPLTNTKIPTVDASTEPGHFLRAGSKDEKAVSITTRREPLEPRHTPATAVQRKTQYD